MYKFDQYLVEKADNIGVFHALTAIVLDAHEAILTLPRWERVVHVFWLLGPFILLIERTPADIWVSLLAVIFVIRSAIKREGAWLKQFWVRAGFVFWFWCIVSGVASDYPSYSVGEALVWFRFPLFAMATAFWLATDRRLLYAMLVSTTLGLLTICAILTAEIFIIGQQGGRLSWPYGDLVPGNYVAKVGLPSFTIMVALAVSLKGRLATSSALFALFTMIISLMTGERINFLIRACGGVLAGLVWKPKLDRVLWLIVAELIAIVLVFSALPNTTARYTDEFIRGATQLEESSWLMRMNGAWHVAQDNIIFGVGTANYRQIAYNGVLDGIPMTIPDVHPHNYYVQILVETGLIGFALGVIFLWSIVWTCFKKSSNSQQNVFLATAWIIPFGVFWPIASSSDFFGQWNNIFLWSSVSLALASNFNCRSNFG